MSNWNSVHALIFFFELRLSAADQMILKFKAKIPIPKESFYLLILTEVLRLIWPGKTL